jgi:hypothetical protein
VLFCLLRKANCQSQFSRLVQDLCVKAPSVAQYLVQEILTHSGDSPQPKVQGSKDNGSGILGKSARKKRSDRTYRPKSSGTQADIHGDETEEVSDDGSLVGDGSVTCQPSHDNVTINQSSASLMTEKPIPECEGGIPEILIEEVPQEGARASAHGPSTSMGSESVLHQLKATYSSGTATRDSVRTVLLDKSTEGGQTTTRPSSLSGAEQRETALPETDRTASEDQATSNPSLLCETEPQETTKPDPIPSTPVRQIGRGFQSPLSDDQTSTPHTTLFTPTVNGEVPSPLTEDDQTASSPDKAEMALVERIPSSPSMTEQQQASQCNTAAIQVQQVDGEQPLPAEGSQTMLAPSPPGEAPTVTDMVAKAVHTIYDMSRRQEVPTAVHSKILSTLRPSLSGTPITTDMAERPGPVWIINSPTTWSATMWINMLDAGHARSKEVTVLNMIEWMGASKWFDTELEQAEKAPPLTKRGVPRKRVATVVLDKYLEDARDTTTVGSPGKLASEDREDYPLSPTSAEIQKRICDTRRKRLNNVFHRGRTLRKLIQMTSLGILFDSNIWYVL